MEFFLQGIKPVMVIDPADNHKGATERTGKAYTTGWANYFIWVQVCEI